jgi:hypothetical protein
MIFTPVQPVPAARPRSGLVASALTPDDNGARWQAGFAWRPEYCPQARGFNPQCGIETPFSTATGPAAPGNVYYSPQAFRVERACAARGGSMEEDLAIVRRQAEAVTSFMIARELQDGALTRSAPYDTPETTGAANPFFADGTATVVAGTYPIEQALGVLEQAARADLLGQDVWIHIPVSWVPLLDQGVLISEGALLRTQAGARVVADAGYTGTGALSAGTSEVQTVTITGAPTGGTFTLTYGGATTSPIPFNASAATVQAILLALPTLEPGDIVVAGGPGPATPYTVTFNAYLGNVVQMTSAGSFTGGTAPAVAVTTTTPGVAPTPAAGNWMYATGPVQVRLDDIRVIPFDDWQFNQRLALADRLFAATFDPCTLHAVQVTIPAPA